jgi:hypothetical protein
MSAEADELIFPAANQPVGLHGRSAMRVLLRVAFALLAAIPFVLTLVILLALEARRGASVALRAPLSRAGGSERSPRRNAASRSGRLFRQRLPS